MRTAHTVVQVRAAEAALMATVPDGTLMDRAATQADAHTIAQQKLQRLSPREYDVMLAVAQGKANAQIASELFMSLATVKAHISHILTKLELGNRTQIALLAHDAGLA